MAVLSAAELEHSLWKHILKLWVKSYDQDGDVLNPNVVMIVGKNAEVADRALLSAK